MSGVRRSLPSVDAAIASSREIARLSERLDDEKAARTRVENIFDQAPALITMMEGPEHRFAYVNRLYEALLGHRPLLGKPVRDAIPEVADQGFFDAIDRVYRTGNPFTALAVPATIERDSGTMHGYFDVVYQPYRDEHGRIDGVIAYGADVTGQVLARNEQQQARAEAELNAQHYRFLAESIPQLVWTTRADGQNDYFNHRWAEYTGAPSPGLGDGWSCFVHPDDQATNHDRWSASLATGAPYEMQFRLRGKDGGYRWFLGRALALRDADQRIIKWFGTATDIDDQKRSEELQRLLASAGTVLGSSLDYRATLAEVERMVVPMLADRCVIELSDDETPTESFEPHVAEGAIGLPLAARGRAFGTLTLWSTAPRRIGPGELAIAEELARRAAMAVDNAKLFELAENERTRATEANRLKDEFLGVVSHELRTPLTAILGWTRILRSKERDSATFARGLDILERNAKAQAQIVDDILDVSRIISGKLRLELRPVDAESLVRTALEVVRPTAEAKGIALTLHVPLRLDGISGDADRLQQVVWNLVSNAVKFTPRGGSVDVMLQPADGHVEIVVRDTGRGIDRRFLPHVFERFRQADSSSSRSHGGLGLGLSIVRHLVELHAGTVRVESAGEGTGSTFVVRLPVRAADHASIPPTSEGRSSIMPHDSLPPPDLAGIDVLVCDDEEDMRELLRTALEDFGATVSTTSSVREAIEAIRAHPPDVLLSDIGMPHEDGYALIQQVRSLGDEIGGLPAIALTAYARPADAQRAFRAGFQLHLAKPVDTNMLARVVRDLTRGNGA